MCSVTPTTATAASGGPLAFSHGGRECCGFGNTVPLAPWSIPAQGTLPWVLSPRVCDGYRKAIAKWGTELPGWCNPPRETIQLSLQSCPSSLVPGEQAGDRWSRTSSLYPTSAGYSSCPGPAPYLQTKPVAHPQTLIPPPASPSSPRLFAGCSSEPVRAGR